jgi:hypothetical protein
MKATVERIKPTYLNLMMFVAELQKSRYQIPTFQRDVTWERVNIKRLWDSIFKFYPIGSFLVWKTDISLHNHREIGGHIFEVPKDGQFQYILDGQQRATSILLSLRGLKGTIAKRADFDPTLYVDLSVFPDRDDSWGYRDVFYFWDEITDEGGKGRRNAARKLKYDKGTIVKLADVYDRTGELDERLSEAGFAYKSPERANLRQYDLVLKTYVLSMIELQGIEVREVCEVFERINKEGQPLDVFDIVVAKTYRNKTGRQEGFYLRELFESLKNNLDGSQYAKLGNLTLLQVLGSVVMRLDDTAVRNITNTYLPQMTTKEIEQIWDDTQTAILKMVKFLEQRLHLPGPNLIPYGYMYPVLANYLYKNSSADYDLLKKWFWYVCFMPDDFDSTTKMRNEIEWLENAKSKAVEWEPIVLNKHTLRTQTYLARGAKSRAILALMAFQRPTDFGDPDRDVLQSVYLELTDKPNLHHFFPISHLQKHPDQKGFQDDPNSLMNIVYLPMIENLNISDKNPLHYIREYQNKNSRFEATLRKHIVPAEVLAWAKDKKSTWLNYDKFIELRIDCFVETIREVLSGVKLTVVDARATD